MNRSIIQAAQNDGVMIAFNGQGNIKARGEPEQVQKWLPLIREYKQSIMDHLTYLWVNKYCDEQTFKQYGNQIAKESGLDRVHEVYGKALAMGINQEQAWDFAEAVAVFEFIKDGRHACFECLQYKHKQGTNQGVCTAAGIHPLEHMAQGASVNWDWLNRCPMHPARNPTKPDS